MPKAERSTPTGSRPASFSGFSEAAIMSRRAATTITSTWGAAPSIAPTPPTTRWSTTAWSNGIAICSWAAKRTAAESSFGFSIAGSRSVRTTTRWLAMPRRTRLPSLCSAKRSLSAAATLPGSVTSPSWNASGGSGAVAAAVTLRPPVAAHLGSADAAGLDLEPDQGGFLRSALLKRGDLHGRGEDAAATGILHRPNGHRTFAFAYQEIENCWRLIRASPGRSPRPIVSGSMKLGGSM